MRPEVWRSWDWSHDPSANHWLTPSPGCAPTVDFPVTPAVDDSKPVGRLSTKTLEVLFVLLAF